MIAFESHPILGSSNQIVDSARARISMRTVPNMDSREAGELLVRKLTRRPPCGAHIEARVVRSTPWWKTDPDGPASIWRDMPVPKSGHFLNDLNDVLLAHTNIVGIFTTKIKPPPALRPYPERLAAAIAHGKILAKRGAGASTAAPGVERS